MRNKEEIVDAVVTGLQAAGGEQSFADVIASWDANERRFYIPRLKAIADEDGRFSQVIRHDEATRTNSHGVFLTGGGG
jgi:hypothetical protein